MQLQSLANLMPMVTSEDIDEDGKYPAGQDRNRHLDLPPGNMLLLKGNEKK
jgi:hypothetical protein